MNLKRTPIQNFAAFTKASRAIAHFSLLVTTKAKTGNGWGIGDEGKESPERKTERGGRGREMPVFAAVFFFPPPSLRRCSSLAIDDATNK